MYSKFTENATKVMEYAKNIAIQLSHNYIGTEHLLIGLLGVKGTASTILENEKITEQTILELVNQLIVDGVTLEKIEQGEFTPRAKKILQQSIREASQLHSKLVGTEHILIALLKDSDCIAIRLLNTLGVNLQKLYIKLMTTVGEDTNIAKNNYLINRAKAKGKSTTPTVDQYSRDLTQYARERRLDPVIGREVEIQRVIQILSRRTKNNPCLVGEPGVGKTAVVEGLAIQIVEGVVPDTIRDKRVLMLDLSGMVAGSKYRGEFEERIKCVMREVMDSGNILLFIDELHTIIGAGGAEGAIDASNILKPSLARGELQIIGATTREEYRKYIEKDAALERRFQPVVVEEPTEEEAFLILKGLRESYELHHKVKITDKALLSAVKMSIRYISDRFLPDKAIDVIDEAASKVRLKTYLENPKIKELMIQNETLELEKEEAIKQEAYELAGSIKKQQEENKNTIKIIRLKEQEEKGTTTFIVDELEVADIISGWTKIPVKQLEQEETERLKQLEKILHQRVVGQKEAVSAVAKAIRRGRVGLKDPNRPTGSFLFLGPTGVGKTELSKALAQAMFESEAALIRVDMSECAIRF